MSSGPWKVKPSEIKRVIATAHEAGLAVTSITMKNGDVVLVTVKAGDTPAVAELTPDDELAQWRGRKNAR